MGVRHREAEELGMFRKYFQVLVLVLVSTSLVSSTCCSQRTVSGVGQLDGVYRYKEDKMEQIEEPCQDGCVYTKEGVQEEYCFRQTMVEEGMVVECGFEQDFGLRLNSFTDWEGILGAV